MGAPPSSACGKRWPINYTIFVVGNKPPNPDNLSGVRWERRDQVKPHNSVHPCPTHFQPRVSSQAACVFQTQANLQIHEGHC